ncbi:MAG: hypothetical protein KDA51_06095, partial [Planctomycetales bacterium]|nr:hypothetical protein [Planctomycetales bacterium]
MNLQNCKPRALSFFIMLFTCTWLLAQQEGADQNERPRRGGAELTIPQVERGQVICFALYTVHDHTLKLTAQLYPLESNDSKTVRLEIMKDGQWLEVARTTVIEPGWTAPLRVENWDDTQAVKYRVLHGPAAKYEGLIRKNPLDKDEIVVAGFTGNSILSAHGGDISRQDL